MMSQRNADLGRDLPLRSRTTIDFGLPICLLVLAALGWWWSVRMAGMHTSPAMEMMGTSGRAMALAPFLLAWLAMMASAAMSICRTSRPLR